MKDKFSRKIVWWLLLFFITLSGFAQMPIFKRYYIADIPGLGWLAKYYVTHYIHYLAAVVLIALAFYAVVDFILQRTKNFKITGTGWFKIFMIAGLLLSGGLMAYKNLPGVFMNHMLISTLDIAHIGFCVLLLLSALYSAIKKKRWLSQI